MTPASGLFASQHPSLKWLLCLYAALITTSVNPPRLFLITGIITLYFLLNHQMLILWLRALSNILPLFIILIAFTLIANLDFYPQLILLARISIIIGLSVYLVHSAPVESMFSFIPRKWSFIRLFLTATFAFVPLFLQSFSIYKTKYQNPFQILTAALHNTSAHIESVRSSALHYSTLNHQHSYLADLPAIALFAAFTAVYFF